MRTPHMAGARTLALLLTCGLLWSSAAGGVSPQEGKLAPNDAQNTYTLTGSVVNAVSGEPLSPAQVQVL